MSADDKGSGGLFFGPPDPGERGELDIGFAPDLDDPRPHPDGTERPWSPAEASAPLRAGVSRAGGPRAGLSAAGPGARGEVRYPLAEAALARIQAALAPVPAPIPGPAPAPATQEDEADAMGDTAAKREPGAPPEPLWAPAEAPAAFSLGPAIMRPPADIARPPPTPPAGAPGAEAGARSPGDTDALLEDMVDLLLVGDDEGRQEVHLSFKEQVFGGLYLRLERRDAGLYAHFQVPDVHARRRVQGHIDDLLARLSRSGMRICGHALEVAEEGEP